MRLKAIIPKSIKLKIRVYLRYLSDLSIDFAKYDIEKIRYHHEVSTIQEIKSGTYFNHKIHNFEIATNKISPIIIKPNQIFSFWKIMGQPNKKSHLKIGRNIVNGIIREEIGGGLCQISTILYINALKANLEIIERYNHSVDIYKEEDRFTALGSDATVVYGYKDLRIKNNKTFPIQFDFTIENNTITCKLLSNEKIETSTLDFVRDYKENHVIVTTIINNKASNIISRCKIKD
jgi:vancomycin resistance protein VanW